MKTNIYFWSYLAQIFLEWEMFESTIVQNIKTRILCSVTFFFFRNHVFCEVMWKNIVDPDKQRVKIWRMRI